MDRVTMQSKFKGSINYSAYPVFCSFTLQSLSNNFSYNIFVDLLRKFTPHPNTPLIKKACFNIKLNHTKFLIFDCVDLQNNLLWLN